MDLSTQIVPAVVILVANLLSGRHASLRWETVTAVFGWGAGVSMAALLVAGIFARDSAITEYLLQVSAFCLLTALSRDYEKILRPLFPWNR
jgi:hypothetical protein